MKANKPTQHLYRAWLYLFIMLMYGEQICCAQATPSVNLQNLFNQNYRYITYLGMDFSKAVLVGDFVEALGVGGDASTKNAYFKAWNNLVTGEFEKYSLKNMLHNGNVTTSLEGVMKMNYATKVDDLSGYKQPNYTKEILQQHLNTYTLPTDKGLGVVLLIESFDKNIPKAFIDFVVIDMATKEIVLLEKLQTDPRGGGLRNYWAGSIYEVFKEVEKKMAKDWKINYLNN